MARTGHYMRHKEAKAEGRQMGSPAPQKIDSGERLRGLAGLFTRSHWGSSAHRPHRQAHWCGAWWCAALPRLRVAVFQRWAPGCCVVDQQGCRQSSRDKRIGRRLWWKAITSESVSCVTSWLEKRYRPLRASLSSFLSVMKRFRAGVAGA